MTGHRGDLLDAINKMRLNTEIVTAYTTAFSL